MQTLKRVREEGGECVRVCVSMCVSVRTYAYNTPRLRLRAHEGLKWLLDFISSGAYKFLKDVYGPSL